VYPGTDSSPHIVSASVKAVVSRGPALRLGLLLFCVFILTRIGRVGPVFFGRATKGALFTDPLAPEGLGGSLVLPFLSMARAGHWVIFLYRSSPRRFCPRAVTWAQGSKTQQFSGTHNEVLPPLIDSSLQDRGSCYFLALTGHFHFKLFFQENITPNLSDGLSGAALQNGREPAKTPNARLIAPLRISLPLFCGDDLPAV